MFGDDCSVQCQATDTCEIHQSCDYYGRLKCKDGWGSYPACNVRLINPALDVDCPQYANTSSSHPPCLNGGSCWKVNLQNKNFYSRIINILIYPNLGNVLLSIELYRSKM